MKGKDSVIFQPMPEHISTTNMNSKIVERLISWWEIIEPRPRHQGSTQLDSKAWYEWYPILIPVYVGLGSPASDSNGIPEIYNLSLTSIKVEIWNP